MEQVINSDGYPEWQVELDITGLGVVKMSVCGKDEDEAAECAMEIVCMVKHNDIGVKRVDPLMNMYPTDKR